VSALIADKGEFTILVAGSGGGNARGSLLTVDVKTGAHVSTVEVCREGGMCPASIGYQPFCF
jgi:hypothetical protein